jgi:hypothetical protein
MEIIGFIIFLVFFTWFFGRLMLLAQEVDPPQPNKEDKNE